MKLDNIDIKIIKNLRKNARSSVAYIARILGVSANTVHFRYKKILESGIIKQTFIPTFLPPYTSKNKLTYKMQMIIKATNEEVKNLINFIREFNLERSQIESWETIGHFNILAWIISENPIDLEVVKDRIQRQNGVIDVKVGIITKMIDSYSKVSLEHLKKEKNNGCD